MFVKQRPNILSKYNMCEFYIILYFFLKNLNIFVCFVYIIISNFAYEIQKIVQFIACCIEFLTQLFQNSMIKL